MSVPMRVFWPQGLVPRYPLHGPGQINTSASPLPKAPTGRGTRVPPPPGVQAFVLLTPRPPWTENRKGGGGGDNVGFIAANIVRRCWNLLLTMCPTPRGGLGAHE